MLKSATANAENNHNLSAEDLFIVDPGQRGAHDQALAAPSAGSAFPIHKPMTHIKVVVEDREA